MTKRSKPGIRAIRPSVRLISMLLSVVLLLCLLPAASAGAVTLQPGETVGMNISGFSTTDIHGEAVSGSVLADSELTVLHFFATWSADCLREMDYMQTASENFEADGVRVFGLLYEDATSTPEACIALMAQYGFTYDCLRLDSVLTALVSEYALIPQTFIVDPSGTVVEHYPGCFESCDQLEQMIESQLGHPGTYYTVVFMDGLTGELISRVTVLHGMDAVPPTPPIHPGYVFAGWDGSYENVTENRYVTAVYVIDDDYFEQGDVDMNGVVNVTDALLTLRYALGLLVSEGVEAYGDMDGNGVINVTDALIILRISIGAD